MSNKLDLSKELIGHRALVTGGSRGIGATLAHGRALYITRWEADLV